MRAKVDTIRSLNSTQGLLDPGVQDPQPKWLSPPDRHYRAIKGDREVILTAATSLFEQQAIFELREQAYRDAEMSYLLRTDGPLHPAEDALDSGSYHFLCEEGGRLVGSCRHTPAIDGQWESPEITRMSTLAPIEQDNLVQLGRLVVANDCRGRTLSELLVWASSDWIHRYTDYLGYYSVCAPRLARFYEHFGTTTVQGANTTLAERSNKVYSLIYAHHNVCRDALEQFLTRQGWELHYPTLP